MTQSERISALVAKHSVEEVRKDRMAAMAILASDETPEDVKPVIQTILGECNRYLAERGLL